MAPLEEGDVVCVAARRQLVRGGQRRPALHLLLLTIVCLLACLLADIVQNIGCGTVADTVCYGRSCVRSKITGHGGLDDNACGWSVGMLHTC